MDENKEVKKDTSKDSEIKNSSNSDSKIEYTLKEKKQFIVILIAIVVIVLALVIFSSINKKFKDNVNTNEEQNAQNSVEIEGNAEVNKNKEVNEAKQVDNLKIDNIQVKKEDGITYMYADVTNIGDTEQGGFKVRISMIDENGTELFGVDQELAVLSPGEKSNISFGTTNDFINAYRCTITKIE